MRLPQLHSVISNGNQLTKSPDPAGRQPVWVDEVVDESRPAQEPRQSEGEPTGAAC